MTAPLPTAVERHHLNRLGCGFSTHSHAQLLRAGGAGAWFEAQLDPRHVAESPRAAALASWFPDLAQQPAAKWAAQVEGRRGGWEYAADLAASSMLRATYSERQLLENMVGFWSNHLHVNAAHDTAWVHRADYDATIRAHALGTFADLLVACSLHPAMLLYLDTWSSVRGHPNENQGRELLELHTVGRTAGYTEQMVKDSATILSGHTVDAYRTWAASYDPGRHTTGPVQVLGFRAANASAADGHQLAVDYLRYLAHHPATARTVATRLCRHFVADRPSAALVDTVAAAFRASGTDIRATLRALVRHPEFAASRGRLVRNPVEDFIATCRALGVTARRPTGEESFARACVWAPQSTVLFQWPRPDGLPLGDTAWCSAARVLSSFRMHWNLAGGWWPTRDVGYRTPASWLPASQVRLDRFVDHLCRSVLGRRADHRLLTAVVQATGYPASTVVTRSHAVIRWQLPRVLGVLLDSPDHMCR